MKTIKIEVGSSVYCDYCNKDFTNSPKSGGVLLGSYAVCPDCTPKLIQDAVRDGELGRVKGKCPEGMSFADWVRNHLR